MQKYENGENLYFCCKCNYKCKTRFLYEQHVKTKKHLKKSQTIKNINGNKISCICGTEYKHNSSYSRHIKTCMFY